MPPITASRKPRVLVFYTLHAPRILSDIRICVSEWRVLCTSSNILVEVIRTATALLQVVRNFFSCSSIARMFVSMPHRRHHTMGVSHGVVIARLPILHIKTGPQMQEQRESQLPITLGVALNLYVQPISDQTLLTSTLPPRKR